MTGRRVLPGDDTYMSDSPPVAGRVYQTNEVGKLVPIKTAEGSEAIPDGYSIVRIDGIWIAAPNGSGATSAWQPWMAVVGGVPEFVVDEDGNPIMVYGPL